MEEKVRKLDFVYFPNLVEEGKRLAEDMRLNDSQHKSQHNKYDFLSFSTKPQTIAHYM